MKHCQRHRHNNPSTKASLLSPFRSKTLKPSDPPDREALVCPHCFLKQYWASSLRCRRCHRLLFSLLRKGDTTSHTKWGGAYGPSFSCCIGSVIRTLREKRKMSQAQLARAMDTDRSHISRIECGRLIPSLPNLERIARAFEIEMLDLFSLINSRGIEALPISVRGNHR